VSGPGAGAVGGMAAPRSAVSGPGAGAVGGMAAAEPAASAATVRRILADVLARRPDLVPAAASIRAAFGLLHDVLASGHSVLVCGNGGSAADSEHIVGELAKPCARPRPLAPDLVAALRAAGDDGYLGTRLHVGFPVFSLASQTALIMAIGNDQGGDLAFAQQVLAYGRPGDLLWALSTSGTSANVLHALRVARALRMRTLGFTGPDGGQMRGLCDVLVRAPGASTPEIQESHLPIYHALCLAYEAEQCA
jgi:phosphoheptose isomerase